METTPSPTKTPRSYCHPYVSLYSIPLDAAEAKLQAWSLLRCAPPMDPAEMAATIASVYRTDTRHAIVSAPEAAAEEAYDTLPLPVRVVVASDNPRTRQRGAVEAVRAGCPVAALATMLAVKGDADPGGLARWAARKAKEGAAS